MFLPAAFAHGIITRIMKRASEMIDRISLPREFRVSSDGACSVIARAGMERVIKDIAAGRADMRLAPGITGRAETYRVTQPGLASPLLVKQYWRGGILRGVMRQRFVGRSRFLAEIVLAEIAADGGVNTARIAGLVLRRTDGIFWSATLVTEEITDSVDLKKLAVEEWLPMTRAQRNELLRAVATEIRKMHDLGVFHSDLHLKNILVRKWQTQPIAYIIDFDRGAFYRRLSQSRRLNNLMRLDRSAEKLNRHRPLISSADRLRLLRYYAAGDSKLFARLKNGARSLATRRKVHRAWWRVISVFRKQPK